MKQCKAITSRGRRCRLEAYGRSKYCYIHQGKTLTGKRRRVLNLYSRTFKKRRKRKPAASTLNQLRGELARMTDTQVESFRKELLELLREIKRR